jgi:hypothetical protein
LGGIADWGRGDVLFHAAEGVRGVFTLKKRRATTETRMLFFVGAGLKPALTGRTKHNLIGRHFELNTPGGFETRPYRR